MKKCPLAFGEIPQMVFSLRESLSPIADADMNVGTAQFTKGMQTSASPDGITVHDKHHKVVFILEGALDIVAEGERLDAKAGDMLVFAKGEPHSATVTEDVKLIFILYGDDEVPSFERE